jgi:hypothetical protein
VGEQTAPLPADKIAERRHHVRRLDLIGSSIPTIIATLKAQAPALVEGETALEDIIREDLEIVRREAIEELSGAGSAVSGASAIVDYIATKRLVLNQAMALAENPSIKDGDRARFLAVASAAADDIAHARGVLVDRPAFNLNPNMVLKQQLLALGLAPQVVNSLIAFVGPCHSSLRAVWPASSCSSATP